MHKYIAAPVSTPHTNERDATVFASPAIVAMKIKG
jgi:hypothetical protein